MQRAHRGHETRGRRVAALAAGLALVSTLAGAARAEPTTASPSVVHLYGEPSVFAGALHAKSLFGAGLAMGLRIKLPGGLDMRVGGTATTFRVGGRGSWSIGGELQIDRPTRSGWRFGGRAAIADAVNEGCTGCGDGTWLEAGPRFRYGSAALGADVLWVRGADHTNAFGLRAHAALGGTSGSVVAATVVIVSALFVGFAIVATGT